MPKYLYLWETDMSRMPTNPNERAALMGKHMEMTKKALEEGNISDWGLFSDGRGGYSIGPENAALSLQGAMQFTPYFKFEIHTALSMDEVTEAMKSMMG